MGFLMGCCGQVVNHVVEEEDGTIICLGMDQDWAKLESREVLEVGLLNGSVNAVKVADERI